MACGSGTQAPASAKLVSRPNVASSTEKSGLADRRSRSRGRAVGFLGNRVRDQADAIEDRGHPPDGWGEHVEGAAPHMPRTSDTTSVLGEEMAGLLHRPW